MSAGNGIPRASTITGTVAVVAFALALLLGSANQSGPIVTSAYGEGFVPLPRGEQGVTAAASGIGVTAAVPVDRLRVAFQARTLGAPRTVRITFDGSPVQTVRVPRNQVVPIMFTVKRPLAAGGHGIGLETSPITTNEVPLLVVGDLTVQGEEAAE